MQANFVHFTAFDPAKVILSAPLQKQVPRSNPPQHYKEVPIQYNYGTAEQPRLDELLVEGPELTSNGGIAVKDEQGGRKSYTIYVQLPEDGDTGRFVQTDELIYASCALQLNQVKGQVGLVNFQPMAPNPSNGNKMEYSKMMAQMLFRPLVSYPRDKTTGEIIQGKPPRAYLKLMKRGFGVTEEKALFTDLNATPIHWDLMSGVEMKFIPVIHYEKIYVGGGKSSLQAKVVSAVVTYLVGKNSQTFQTSTIERLTQQRPDAANTLAEQIAKLTMDRQDLLIANKAPAQPTGTMQAITDGQQPNQQQGGFVLGNGVMTPTVPTQAPQGHTTSGLNDFLANNPMNNGTMVGLPQIPTVPMTPQAQGTGTRTSPQGAMNYQAAQGTPGTLRLQ